jgi:hypothetical protein
MKAAEGAPALKGKAMWQLGVIKGLTMRQLKVKGICTQGVTVRQLEVIKEVIKGATKGPSRVGSSEDAPRDGGIEAHPIQPSAERRDGKPPPDGTSRGRD